MRWVIGDIHGMLRALDGLLAAVAARDPASELIFVGDYVNRGPDSRGVIDRLLSLPPGRATFLRGNHDDVFDCVVNGTSYAGRSGEFHQLHGFQWFMRHGLDKTFLSYGADAGALEDATRNLTTDRLARLIALVPEAHRRFVRSLPALAEHDTFFVAHAMWEPDQPDKAMAERLANDEALRKKILWDRYELEELAGPKAWKRRGYFGHTPTHNYQDGELLPVIGPRIVILDTAAALLPEGRLTAFCADSHTFVQVDREGNPVEA